MIINLYIYLINSQNAVVKEMAVQDQSIDCARDLTNLFGLSSIICTNDVLKMEYIVIKVVNITNLLPSTFNVKER